MKKYRRLLVFSCALLGASQCGAQIAISNTQALAFGKFAAGSGGTIAIGPNGVRTPSGGVRLLNSAAGTAASFNVHDTNPANANLTYIITLPDNDVVTLTSGSHNMAVNNFVSTPSGSSMLVGGTQVLTVGATLSVGANQPQGSYSGNFSVTVNYQ
ncbi:DUF4402 domain-containing protein [Lacisediminimonas sp.]|uniref:DUF4402 domain-containing protein n=1 Tax=Lacisediminimonas sp. TaxID=3060582 RepID=UPI002728B42C|nr:DUF4402 domain-containing protein [Lacisediminimonas sp.]MDO8301292.1 DUF4402 domain-containing protein [Lacisediminimonas sp.]